MQSHTPNRRTLRGRRAAAFVVGAALLVGFAFGPGRASGATAGADPSPQPAASALAAAAARHEHSHAGHATTQPGVVSLDAYSAGGQVHLLIARRESDGPARLEYIRSGDDGRSWMVPVPVGDSEPAPDPIHRGMDAQIAAAGDHLVAAWTTAGTLDKYGRGPIATAVSVDGGRTWEPGPNPSDDGLATGHAFLDLAADASGTFHLVWLDSRDHPSSSTDGDTPHAGKGLRYARSIDGGITWSHNVTLVRSTCECCWNTIAITPEGGLAVLFRQFSPRDMAVIRSKDGGRTWGKPVTVGAFGWDVNACPHVGGGLSFAPGIVNGGGGADAFATVWTARPGAAGGYLLHSTDGGSTWQTPMPLGAAGAPAWHTDVARGPGGQVAVAWDAYMNNGLSVFASASTNGGRSWTPPRQVNRAGASASFPRLVATRSGFRAFWTELGPDNVSRWASADVSPRASQR